MASGFKGKSGLVGPYEGFNMTNGLMGKHVLLRHRDIENIGSVDVYLANDGYVGLKKALKEMKPEDVMNEVKTAGLRGRRRESGDRPQRHRLSPSTCRPGLAG